MIVSKYFALSNIGSICSMCLEPREEIAHGPSVSMWISFMGCSALCVAGALFGDRVILPMMQDSHHSGTSTSSSSSGSTSYSCSRRASLTALR